jgi:hypothetical protein
MAWQAKNFEEKMHPCIDEIYRGLFSKLDRIDRSNRETTTDSKVLFMDKELSIDTFLYFKDGTMLTLQEKSRKHDYLKYADFTFEYYNDPRTKDEGEWFKLAAQLYFYGFVNESETGYVKYYLMNVPKLRIFLKNNIGIKTLEEKYLHPNRPPAKANFFAIPFSIIPDYCIMHKKVADVA